MRHRTILMLLLLFFWGTLLECSGGDYDISPKPAAPNLPPAGGKYLDPTFKTEILRVTDRRDKDLNYHSYSFWSPFNADSTRFWIMVGNTATVYDFDPDRLELRAKAPLYGDMILFSDCLNWDTVDPDVIYSVLGKRLYKISVSSRHYSVLKDFENILPYDISYLTVSGDNRFYSFLVGGQGKNDGVAGAYDIKTDTLHTCDLGKSFGYTNIHSTSIDKSGRVVWISGLAGSEDKAVWEIQSGKVQFVKSNKTERAHGHRAMGTNTIYQLDNWVGGNVIKRELDDNPGDWKWIHENRRPDWNHEAHISANHRDESTIFVSRLTVKESKPAPLQDEIYQVCTDGSNTIERLAHHRSVFRKDAKFGGYYSYPKAASSYDGRFVMFTSNWDDSPYVDVFILKVPDRIRCSRPAR